MWNRYILNNFTSINFFSLIAFLIPFFLITGPFLPDLSIIIIGLFFLYRIFKFKEYDYLNNIYFKFFFLFWIYLVLSSFLSDNILYSLKSSLGYIRFIIFSLGILYLIERNKNFIKNFFISLVIVFILLGMDSVIQFIFGQNIFGFKSPAPNIITSFFDDEIVLGSFLVRLSPLFLALCFKINKINLSVIIFMILLEPLIFYAGSRTPFFISFLIIGLLLILNKRNIKNLIIITVSTLLILTQVFYNKGSHSYNQRMVSDIVENFERDKPSQLDINNKYSAIHFLFISPSHSALWINALTMYEKKKLFGHGPGTFRKICNDTKIIIPKNFSLSKGYFCSTHPHNFSFQLLAETGIIGFLFFIIFFLYFVFRILNFIYLLIFKENVLVQNNYIISFLILSFIINFLPIVPNGNFFNNWLNIIMYLPLGFYLYYLKNIKKND